jgi:hypothetical protein
LEILPAGWMLCRTISDAASCFRGEAPGVELGVFLPDGRGFMLCRTISDASSCFRGEAPGVELGFFLPDGLGVML